MRHKRRGASGKVVFLVEKKSVVARQLREAVLKLVSERVIKLAARPPEKFDAQLPRRLGLNVELLRLQSQILEKMFGERDGRSLAHANHSDVGTANDAHAQVRQFALEGNGDHEARAAATKDDDRANGCWEHE